MATPLIRFPGIVLAAVLAMAASGTATAVTLSGPHAEEPFCKAMARQLYAFEMIGLLDTAGPDPRVRRMHVEGKAASATLVETAPPSLAREVALQTKNIDAALDAEMSRDSGKKAAAAASVGAGTHRTADERMRRHCGMLGA